MSYTYDYPRPMLTVDCLAIRRKGNIRQVLLIKRGNAPFFNYWALPGGFVDMDEDLEPAALRELYEETGIKCTSLEQLFTVGTPGRDPRGRTVSVIYYAQIDDDVEISAGDDAVEAAWFDLSDIPTLIAFDHKLIIDKAIAMIKQ